ncbi:MAG TPA: hypothetical protein VHW67_01255 [Solirubrobacteraceae bacterium]|jgi:hypothetical protein|nr:hypothetical protein [Solirubrobacteraceae bacterium]
MLVRTFKAALATGIAIAVLVVAQEVARAGQYHVYSCRMPDGQAAPADGWSGSKTGTYSYTEDTCSLPGGGLVAALGDEPSREANADVATWGFGALAGTTISGATLWRAADADGGGGINASYETWFAAPLNSTNVSSAFGWCVSGQECPVGVGDTAHPLAEANRLEVPSSNLGFQMFFNASCIGESAFKCPAATGDSNGYAAAVYLYAADLTLEQPAGPHASNVSGELTSAPTVRGASDVAFDATDPGAGVYEALFSIDGRVVQRTVLNDNGGRCRDVGESSDGLPAFLYLQPCLQSLSANTPFQTTTASNGAHRLTVSVIDAAGNAAPVLDRLVTIDNPPPPGLPNGTNASAQATLSVRWSGTRRSSLLSGFGRARTLTGRLTTASGAPIVDAAIDLRATPSYAGARPVAMISPHTDADGRFTMRVQATSSRTLRFAYRAHTGDRLPAATRTLKLSTRAGIELRVRPHVTSVGHSILFRGRLRGGPIPREGKQLVLEARSPGSGWIEFKVVRTDGQGRYRASYRFKFAGPANYSFRARSEAESDFPFAAGASNLVGVHER